MPERNTELLQQVMQHINDHPRKHDQAIFVNTCGTAACFAGWAALLSGMTVAEIDAANMWEKGAQLLGLTAREAGDLFTAENTRPMLELMVKDLVNGDRLRSPDDYWDEVVG